MKNIKYLSEAIDFFRDIVMGSDDESIENFFGTDVDLKMLRQVLFVVYGEQDPVIERLDEIISNKQ